MKRREFLRAAAAAASVAAAGGESDAAPSAAHEVRSHFVSRRSGQMRLHFSGFHRRRYNGGVCLQRRGLPRLTALIVDY